MRATLHEAIADRERRNLKLDQAENNSATETEEQAVVPEGGDAGSPAAEEDSSAKSPDNASANADDSGLE